MQFCFSATFSAPEELVTLARAWALVRGRDYVGPDDVRALAVPVLSHRITLDDDAWVRFEGDASLANGIAKFGIHALLQ